MDYIISKINSYRGLVNSGLHKIFRSFSICCFFFRVSNIYSVNVLKCSSSSLYISIGISLLFLLLYILCLCDLFSPILITWSIHRNLWAIIFNSSFFSALSYSKVFLTWFLSNLSHISSMILYFSPLFFTLFDALDLCFPWPSALSFSSPAGF